MDSNPDSTLNALGLDFIKRVCSIDQKFAHNFLSILSLTIQNDNFEDVPMSFKRLIAKNGEGRKNTRKYR